MSCSDSMREDIFRLIYEEGPNLCRGCLDAKYAPTGDDGPEEWWCSHRDVFPGGKGCIKKGMVDEAIGQIYLTIAGLSDEWEIDND